MSPPAKTALLSVADRTGIVDFARGLRELGYVILSSGGTAESLRRADVPVRDVADLTRHPDICGGRLRLIHPRLFAAITADRDDPALMRELERESIPPIDLAALNLYPLSQVLEAPDLKPKEVADFLDVSAAALLRAAARSFPFVLTLCDPGDYPRVLEALREGKGLSIEKSRSLAAKAFYYVSYYDSTVAQYLNPAMETLPDEMIVSLKKAGDLRYGENPHQRAALYSRSGARPWGLGAASVVYGKPLHYNHYLGMERAAELAAEFQRPACAIVKHDNPAGAASDDRLCDAARLAHASDPAGCRGGVAAFNREVDSETAQHLAPEYLECVAAPEFSREALETLRAKRDLRLVQIPSLLLSPNEIDIKTISGGLLVQDKDNPTGLSEYRAVTRRTPADPEAAALDFAWRVCKHATSHAAVLAKGTVSLGIAAGQATEMDAIRLAAVKSQERHPVVTPDAPLVFASDGPLSPGHVAAAAEGGVVAIIQPGGSSEDKDSVERADELGLAMIFTGVRHFRH